MRAAAIIFHKNVDRYPLEWTQQCIRSLQEQTIKWVRFYEMDYGCPAGVAGRQIMEGSQFMTADLPTHAHAHNALLDAVFADGFDCAFNVNIDDWYEPDRFAKQLPYMDRYDVVSSNFYLVNDQGRTIKAMLMNKMSVHQNLRRGHNVIAHPVVCYSKRFWLNCSRLDPAEIPEDDLKLWQRSISQFSFLILRDYLLYYRVHDKKTS